jgi:hypothetical protein
MKTTRRKKEMAEKRREEWYTWKLLKDDRLRTPMADPREYEDAFDYLFKTPEEAQQGLVDFNAEEDAKAEGWILCKMTLEEV